LIGFKIKNASVKDIHRGMVACDPKNQPCKVTVFEILMLLGGR